MQIECRRCPASWEVSEEDPDATMQDAYEHVDTKHPRALGEPAARAIDRMLRVVE